LSRVTSCAQLLSACRATYLTRGIASLREIPTASVDFIWSHAVLEHVRRHEFTDYLRETRRVLRPTGVSSHEVDLRDHLGGALNNLRLSSKVWEADWMTRSGFYTNRLSRKEIMAAFAAAGLDATVIREVRWDSLPTPVDKFAEEFRAGDAGERLVNIFDVIARPVG
jgi:SAM-dependent methyltransferase